MIKERDQEYQDQTITSVEEHDGNYWVKFEDGFMLAVTSPGFEIKASDEARLYGKGIGYSVRGLDINGREVYYRTEEQARARTLAALEENKRARQRELDDKGGVRPDPGAGKYDWRIGMGEISGFGGTYEAACRSMLIRALDFWDEQGEGFDPKYHSYENITGVMVDDNADAKKLDAAMMDAEIVYGNGERERCGDNATGAMHQAVVSHAFYVRKNGWESYVGQMSRRRDDEEEGPEAAS